MALNIGQRVKTLIDSQEIEIGSIGVIRQFDIWPGEEYPYIVAFPNGGVGAYARFELRVVTMEEEEDVTAK